MVNNSKNTLFATSTPHKHCFLKDIAITAYSILSGFSRALDSTPQKLQNTSPNRFRKGFSVRTGDTATKHLKVHALIMPKKFVSWASWLVSWASWLVSWASWLVSWASWLVSWTSSLVPWASWLTCCFLGFLTCFLGFLTRFLGFLARLLGFLVRF